MSVAATVTDPLSNPNFATFVDLEYRYCNRYSLGGRGMRSRLIYEILKLITGRAQKRD